MKTILVVEDEMKIARLVRDYLQHAGFEVIVTGEGGSALASARGSKPDLMVLDLGLPGRDGLDVTRELRRSSNGPIVMLTARGDEADRIVGLELGADDYIVKPIQSEGAGRANQGRSFGEPSRCKPVGPMCFASRMSRSTSRGCGSRSAVYP